MSSIGIWVNPEKDTGFCLTKEIIAAADDLGVKCEISQDGEYYDIIISLGGDGTFLAAARHFYERSIPIAGVNLGKLGYLSEISKDDVKTAIERIVSGDYKIEERILLEAECNNQKIYALNEIVVSRTLLAKLIKMDVFLDNRLLDIYNADGIIISTPTGSTAYSLSAGGPIIEPDLDVLIVNPICPHSLNQRPIIISSEKIINVKPEASSFVITADGQDAINVKEKQDVMIKKAQKAVRIIKLKDNTFFDTVREKLM